MKEKDNKGFWDRWAKRYDFMMSKDSGIYAQIAGLMALPRPDDWF